MSEDLLSNDTLERIGQALNAVLSDTAEVPVRFVLVVAGENHGKGQTITNAIAPEAVAMMTEAAACMSRTVLQDIAEAKAAMAEQPDRVQ